MSIELMTVTELESKIAGATGSARQVYLDKLRAEVKRLEGIGEFTPSQAKARIKVWLEEADDDRFDNMPV